MTKRMKQTVLAVGLLAAAPFTMGAKGGCGTFGSMDPAPSVSGDWNIIYNPQMSVVVKIGGAVYTQQLSTSGGTFTVVHAGKSYPFNVDCSRPEVVCPSEVWPARVTISQREPMYPYRMWVTIPVQECSGAQVPADRASCGTGTLNPDCKPVCNGTITTKSADAFGLIREGGGGFDLLLGAGVATNGINCALLGISVAKAELINTGTEGSASWQAAEMNNGQVKTGYAGGCVWAGPLGADGKPETLVLGASVEITTGFAGSRAR